MLISRRLFSPDNHFAFLSFLAALQAFSYTCLSKGFEFKLSLTAVCAAKESHPRMAVMADLTNEELSKQLSSLIFDERKLVSYKWLTHHFRIPVSQSKQLLAQFEKDHRNPQSTPHNTLFINYVLTGLKTNPTNLSQSQNSPEDDDDNEEEDEDIQMTPSTPSNSQTETESCYHITVVPSEKLEEAKESFTTLIGCHVYSILAVPKPSPEKEKEKEEKGTEGESKMDVDEDEDGDIMMDEVRKTKTKSAKSELSQLSVGWLSLAPFSLSLFVSSVGWWGEGARKRGGVSHARGHAFCVFF